MPLLPGKKNQGKNIATEMEYGKPQKQAIAISYSVLRRNKKHKKASGGTVESGSHDMNMARGGKAKLGSGKRFEAVERSAAASGAKDPAAVAAAAGRAKYGEAKMAKMAAAGKRHKHAEGGDVYQQKGVHTPVDTKHPGKSHMGAWNEYPEKGNEVSKALSKQKREENSKIQPNLKGLADGGSISASNEKRPMPDNSYDDAHSVSRNSGDKPPKHDSWTDNSTVAQAQNNSGRKVMPIKRPRMVPTNAYSTRLYDAEGNLQESAKPGPYDEQPPEYDNEMGPNRQGPKVRDMEDEHSTHRKPYAKGGQIEPSDEDSHNIDMHTDMEPMDSGIQEEERSDEADLQSSASPSQDEGTSDADSLNEEDPNRQGDEVPDMEDEHSTHRKPYAGGGEISDDEENIDNDVDGEEPATHGHSKDDSEEQPHEEEQEEHHDSIAAAIMARRERLKAEIDSGSHDMDIAARMAEGGEILSGKDQDIHSHGSDESDDSDQADLSRNHDEDANEEDQMSFGALRKENYNDSDLEAEDPQDSAQTGDSEEEDSENKHDMISSIRRKMNTKRQFSSR